MSAHAQRPPSGRIAVAAREQHAIVSQALGEVENIVQTGQRVSEHLEEIRKALATMRRSCRNLGCDVRGLGRLLEDARERQQ